MEIHQQKEREPFNQKSLVRIIIFGFVAFLIIIVLTNTTFLTIKPGEKGVLFKRFTGGLDKEHIYGEGFHMILPWNNMYIYDVRIKESFEKMEVLSKNGLNIKIELSYRYYPEADKIGELHEKIGKNYQEYIIKPEIRSSTREVIGKYLPEELYSTKREAIQDEIFEQTYKALKEKYIILDAVLIREVSLPQTLQNAIENKLKQEQESLEYEYRLEKERKEAERRIIEAEAKSKANNILNKSLTDKILKDKGIEATLKLAESPNSKTVIIGGGKNGLPIILNSGDK
ncbi:MAG TPA: prohibitin family protein [Bacteroidetes bacterium]|nr:prohibitin family protein [Bacteroidota bacterium]